MPCCLMVLVDRCQVVVKWLMGSACRGYHRLSLARLSATEYHPPQAGHLLDLDGIAAQRYAPILAFLLARGKGSFSPPRTGES